MAITSEILGDALIAVGKRVRAGKCEISQEQMDTIFEDIQNAVDVPISKEHACGILGISRSTFDAKVASGELPKGKHRRGFKELVFFRRELSSYQNRTKRQ